MGKRKTSEVSTPSVYDRQENGFLSRAAWRVNLPAILLIGLIALSGPPTVLAQTFSPTDEEKTLCKLEKTANAAGIAKQDHFDLIRKGLAPDSKDFHRLSDEAFRATKAWKDYYFSTGYNEIHPDRKKQYIAWCLGISSTDFTDKIGMKTTVQTPQEMRHVITVYMPETPIYHSVRKTLFRVNGKAPPFHQANIWGKVEWYYGKSMDYGPAAGVVVKAVHWLNGKPQRHVKTTTDSAGEFRLNLPVKAPGGQAARRFPAFPKMTVKRGKLPPGMKFVVPPGQQTGPPGGGAVQQPEADWKKTVFNGLSMYHALKKDFDDKKLGGKGTPNFDKWKKNHKAGRDSINALNMIIDIASGKATGHAQAVDNAFKAYKNLTGKPLPFEKKISKQQASAMKQASRDFWAWIERNKQLEGN